MPSKLRKWIYITTGIVLGLVLVYPVAGNLLLYSGALENIISKKPEKLKIKWDNAWTLIPGRINIEGFNLDIHTKKNRIQINIDEGVVDLSLLSLTEKTVDITYGNVDGFRISHTKRPEPETETDTTNKADQTGEKKETATVPTTDNTAVSSPTKKNKPPWIIQLENVSASNVESIQFNKLKLVGRGELKDYAMRLVTKGGPLRIDNIDLDMKTTDSSDTANSGEKFADIKAKLRLAENIPKQNKGKKLLKFISGRVGVVGDAGSIQFIRILLGNKFNLNVAGTGKLDMLLIAEDGQLMDGTKMDFDSEHFETDFLTFHASGHGKIVGGVNKGKKDPVSLHIKVGNFELARQKAPNPYLEGADLSVELSMQRFLLHEGIEQDAQLFVNFPDSVVRDLTDYNRFIPKHANVEILSGNGRLRGTMALRGDVGNIYTDLSANNVVLNIDGNKIRTDFQLVTNLSDGNYGEKSYDLTGTFFRMEDTELVTVVDETEKGWWGEIKISKGDLIWNEPMDIDAEMQIKMRDTEPLVALLRDTSKKKSLLDTALTVKDLEGRLGIQTNDKDIVLDPILIKGKGLEVISKLDVAPKSINGALYFKLHGIAANFEIKNNKAKFKGLGGKKKVEKQVGIGKADIEKVEKLVHRNPHVSRPVPKNLQ